MTEIEIGLDDVDVLANHSSMSWGDVEIKFSDEVKELLAPLYGIDPTRGKLYETNNEGFHTTASGLKPRTQTLKSEFTLKDIRRGTAEAPIESQIGAAQKVADAVKKLNGYCN